MPHETPSNCSLLPLGGRVDDPAPESKLGREERNKRPEPAARMRRKNLETVSACYMPKYKDEHDESFKAKAIEYALQTGFGVEKIKILFREFLSTVKYVNPKKPPEENENLQLGEFLKLMAKHHIHDKGLITRLFNVHDPDRGGTIAFLDYLEILAVFTLPHRSIQAKALFAVCDIDGDRSLGKMELLKFINIGVEKDKRQVVSAILDELMDQMDCEDVGEIRYQQFLDAVVGDDEVWSLFRALSPFTRMINEREERGLQGVGALGGVR